MLTKRRSPSSSHRPPDPDRLELAQQLDDLALLAKLDPVAAVGDELARGAEHVDDQHAGIEQITRPNIGGLPSLSVSDTQPIVRIADVEDRGLRQGRPA